MSHISPVRTARNANKHVYLVGGANSAGQAAIHLAEYADGVTMLVRGGALNETMSRYLSARILSHPKIRIRFNTEVTELDGNSALRTIGIMAVSFVHRHLADSL